VLQAQLELARSHGLPAIVHCFHAHPELRALLERDGPPPAGLVIHSYSGGPELVKIFTRLGCHFGLAGPVTYANSRRPLGSARAIPSERLMLETDAPDQAPTPHRGQRSEPAFLPHIAQAIADARGVPLAELVAQTTANAVRLFKLGATGT
jgi:TatD DNase family protein